jgi:hypothetical protein
VANLELGLIETTADGFLQIKPGYPWQIVQPPSAQFPNGSILWRIFRGYNERRLACGLPLVKYQNNSFLPASSLDDATIVSGANLQNYRFWRRLQEVMVQKTGDNQYAMQDLYFPAFATFDETYRGVENGTFRALPSGSIDGSFVRQVGENISQFVVPATAYDINLFLRDTGQQPISEYYNAAGTSFSRFVTGPETSLVGYIEPGDIIGTHTINDLLKMFSRIRNFSVTTTCNIRTRVWFSQSGQLFTQDENCAAAYAGANLFTDDRLDDGTGLVAFCDLSLEAYGDIAYAWSFLQGEIKDATCDLSPFGLMRPAYRAVTAALQNAVPGNAYYDVFGGPEGLLVQKPLLGLGGSEYNPQLPPSLAFSADNYHSIGGSFSDFPPKSMFPDKTCANKPHGPFWTFYWLQNFIIGTFADTPN